MVRCQRLHFALVAAAIAATSTPAIAQRPPSGPGTTMRYDGYQRVRAQITSARDLLTVSAAGGQVAACEGAGIGPSDFILPPGAADVLTAAGIKFTVLNKDIQTLIDAERAQINQARAAGAAGLRGPGWFSTYHTYDEINAYVDTLVAAHPELASRFTVGQSLENRTVFGIRITSAVGTNKPQIFLNSMQHAREWITGATTMWIADTLVNTYATDAYVQRLLDSFEFLIVPMSNPDGYVYTWTNERLWRKNRRPNADGSLGVDTNRNWGYQWGGPGASTNPADDTFRGTGPFSEPETQILRDFVLANPRIVMSNDVHSYSQFILSPWGYGVDVPPDEPLFDALDAGMEHAMEASAGLLYSSGPTYTTIYPASGIAVDWAFGGAGVLGFSYELRDRGQFGFILPADQIVPAAQEAWAGIRWAADWLLDTALYIAFPGGDPTSIPSGASATIPFEVRRARLFPDTATVRLLYRVGRSGAFVEAPLTTTATGGFQATVSPGPCNSVTQYYVEAHTTTGLTVRYPAGGAAAPLEAVVRRFTAALSDGFETNLGWTAGVAGDTATAGVWVRGNPIGTAGGQPEDAHGGTNCFFTGQGTVGGGVNAADVDNGFTTLLSPAINLTGATDARISYWRWYVNNTQGNYTRDDVFTVDVSTNGGATWTNAETIGPNGLGTQGGWVNASWLLSRLSPPMTPTANMRVRFIASDTGNQQLLEAAVDDFLVESIACPLPPCPGDWDGDGVVTPSDVAAFVGAWFADLNSGTTQADFDHNGSITPSDVAAFVGAWFASLSGSCGS